MTMEFRYLISELFDPDSSRNKLNKPKHTHTHTLIMKVILFALVIACLFALVVSTPVNYALLAYKTTSRHYVPSVKRYSDNTRYYDAILQDSPSPNPNGIPVLDGEAIVLASEFPRVGKIVVNFEPTPNNKCDLIISASAFVEQAPTKPLVVVASKTLYGTQTFEFDQVYARYIAMKSISELGGPCKIYGFKVYSE